MENEISRLGIQFGNDLDSQEPKSFLSAQISLSALQAQTQSNFLKEKAGSEIDSENSFIVVLTAESAEGQGKMVEILNQFLPEDDCSQATTLLSLFGMIHQKGKLPFKVYPVGERKVYVCFSFGSSSSEILSAISMLSSNGLDEMANTQENTIELSFKTSNDFDTIKNFMDNGESIVSSVLQSAKIEVLLKLNKDFGLKISEVVSQIDEEFANSPPLMFCKLFKSIDVDFRFGSTAELPLKVREIFMDPLKKFSEIFSSLSQQMKDEGKEKDFTDLLDTELEVYATMKDLMAIKMAAVGPNLRCLFK